MGEKTYTVKQVSEMSGASIRALHHYEELGLLVPQRRPNGYRAYGTDDIARLQQILLFRACGMGLADIAKTMAQPAFDEAAALRAHLDALVVQKEDLETLICTVRKTIDSLEGDVVMSDKERFEGLKRAAVEANEKTYGAEARERYGDAAVDAANERLLAMDEAEWNDKEQLEDAIIEQLKEVMRSSDATGAEAQKLARMHARWIAMHWGEGAYSREAHLQLAQAYLADARFTAYYDERAGEGATAVLVEALEACL